MSESLVHVSRIYRFEGDSKLKAFVDVSLSGFVIKGLRIVEGKNGLFLGMPRHQGKDGNWYNTVYTNNKELHRELTNLVLTAYKD